MTVPAGTFAPLDHPRDGEEPSPSRFFWTVLILATAASIGGNVTHAVLNAESGSLVAVAAAVAMVPPIVLLAATHSVGLLVRNRNSGPIYWSALAMTIGLAGCAFALSFDALWELAVSAGVRKEIAWLWPLSIDVSIAQATLALLSLTRRRAHTQTATRAPATPAATSTVTSAPATITATTNVPTTPRPRVAKINGHRRTGTSPMQPVAQITAPHHHQNRHRGHRSTSTMGTRHSTEHHRPPSGTPPRHRHQESAAPARRTPGPTGSTGR